MLSQLPCLPASGNCFMPGICCGDITCLVVPAHSTIMTTSNVSYGPTCSNQWDLSFEFVVTNGLLCQYHDTCKGEPPCIVNYYGNLQSFLPCSPFSAASLCTDHRKWRPWLLHAASKTAAHCVGIITEWLSNTVLYEGWLLKSRTEWNRTAY